MIHACRTIPRSANVVFHIRIEREEFTIQIERRIKFIAETVADHFLGFPIWTDLHDEAARSHSPVVVTTTIRHARKDMIFFPSFCHSVGGYRGRHVRVITSHHVNRLFIRAQHQTMRSVLATGF